MASINFLGRGQNIVGDIVFPEMNLDPPVSWANYDFLNQSTKGCYVDNETDWDDLSDAGTW